MANFLAMLFITSGRDCCTKNYYAYHDLHTDTWWYLPWDIDLTLGRNWTGTYFDDRMFPRNALYQGSNNNLTARLFALPDFLEIYHRRVRSLADQLMNRPGTPYEERYLEPEVDRWMAHIGADAELDNAAWGTWGVPQTMAEAVRILKEEWAIPRREFIFDELAQSAGGPVVTLLDGVPGAAVARYRVPTDDGLGAAWTDPAFDDSRWLQGPLGVGYENGAGYEALIGTVVRPADIHPEATTVLVRVPFELAALPERPVLRMKYDDGYVAWLNGVEVSRRNVGAGLPSWRAVADVHDDGEAVRFEDVDVGAWRDALRVGRNVLAIQLVNAGANSSDLLLLPALVDGQPAGDGPLPPAQGPEPDVFVAESEASGATSYVVVENHEDTAVDLTGWLLVGRGIEHRFAAGTVLPTGGRLHVVAHLPSFRERAEGPRGGQRLLLQGNWAGELQPDGELWLGPEEAR